MTAQFILDTGPLVAWLCPRDEHHLWARRTFAQLPSGGLVYEADLAEACHLAAKDGITRGKVIEFVERGHLNLVSLAGELPFVRKLLDQYADAPMDFADASLLWVADELGIADIATLDSAFHIYRTRRGRRLRNRFA